MTSHSVLNCEAENNELIGIPVQAAGVFEESTMKFRDQNWVGPEYEQRGVRQKYDMFKGHSGNHPLPWDLQAASTLALGTSDDAGMNTFVHILRMTLPWASVFMITAELVPALPH